MNKLIGKQHCSLWKKDFFFLSKIDQLCFSALITLRYHISAIFKGIIRIIYFSKNYSKDYSFQPPSKILKISGHSTSLSSSYLFSQALVPKTVNLWETGLLNDYEVTEYLLSLQWHFTLDLLVVVTISWTKNVNSGNAVVPAQSGTALFETKFPES